MKKIILSVATVVACTLSVSAQQRTILYEEFTGENCGPCAAANPGLETLVAANPGKILHVAFMEPVPSSGYFYQSQKTLNDDRFFYYNAIWSALAEEFTPSGFMDGIFPDSTTPSSGSGPCGNCGNVAAFVQSDIDAEYAVPSPFSITATHYFNTAHDSVYGTVIIKGVATYGGSRLQLRAAYTKSMTFSREPGDNSETFFADVARTMYPSESGQTIAAHWTTSTIDTYYYKGKTTGLDTFTNVTVSDSNFVVWIQNDSVTSAATTDFRVQQAALSVYTPLTVTHTGVAQVTNSSTGLNIYPNPAKESTTVYFTLGHDGNVQVTVTDELGRIVTNTPSQSMNAGNQSVTIATNSLATGIYTVTVQAEGETFTKKLSVTK